MCLEGTFQGSSREERASKYGISTLYYNDTVLIMILALFGSLSEVIPQEMILLLTGGNDHWCMIHEGLSGQQNKERHQVETGRDISHSGHQHYRRVHCGEVGTWATSSPRTKGCYCPSYCCSHPCSCHTFHADPTPKRTNSWSCHFTRNMW